MNAPNEPSTPDSPAPWRLHIHGASVTAQAAPGGYFALLDSAWAAAGGAPAVFSRTAYGGSHFDIAGFHFITEATAAAPAVCLLEWATTSAKAFDPQRVDAVMAHLRQRGCLPIWLLMPRLDDPEHQRGTLRDAREAAARWQVPLIDLTDLERDGVAFSAVIRDVVHTHPEGGRLYAQALCQRLAALDLAAERGRFLAAGAGDADHGAVPQLYGGEAVPAALRHVEGTVSVPVQSVGGSVEVVVEGWVGPHSPLLQVALVDADGHSAVTQEVNLFDGWCHYRRRMVSRLLLAQVPAGRYALVLTVLDEDPRDRVELRKPEDTPFTGARHVDVQRLSLLNLAPA